MKTLPESHFVEMAPMSQKEIRYHKAKHVLFLTQAAMREAEKRPVKITQEHGMIFVRYADRKKRQHHFAAQFDGKDHTVEQVRHWVSLQPNIREVQQ